MTRDEPMRIIIHYYANSLFLLKLLSLEDMFLGTIFVTSWLKENAL